MSFKNHLIDLIIAEKKGSKEKKTDIAQRITKNQ